MLGMVGFNLMPVYHSYVDGSPCHSWLPTSYLCPAAAAAAYLEMMLQVMALGHPLIVVECAAVAMRLGAVSTTDEVVGAVVGIMDKLGVEEACVIGHSYGEAASCSAVWVQLHDCAVCQQAEVYQSCSATVPLQPSGGSC